MSEIDDLRKENLQLQVTIGTLSAMLNMAEQRGRNTALHELDMVKEELRALKLHEVSVMQFKCNNDFIDFLAHIEFEVSEKLISLRDE